MYLQLKKIQDSRFIHFLLVLFITTLDTEMLIEISQVTLKPLARFVM